MLDQDRLRVKTPRRSEYDRSRRILRRTAYNYGSPHTHAGSMRGLGKPNQPPERACETTTNRTRPSAHEDRLFRGDYFQSESGTSLPRRGALGVQGLPLVIRAEKWSRFSVSR